MAGRYKAEKLLGKGGFGSVYRAQDLELGRPVAIKILDKSKLGNEEALARFAREAKVQGTLEHPNLVKLYDFSIEPAEARLVMEYVEGRDLRTELEEDGPRTPEGVLRLAREIGGALDAMHAANMVHRDLKPANVMIHAEDGRAMVMDLGLVRVVDGTVMTRTGAVMGTPRYYPPEVLKRARMDARADQFQMAAILFEALTGKTLIQANTLEEVVAVLSHARFTEIPAGVDAPENFRAALRRATEVDPAARFPTCGDLVAALEDPGYRHARRAAAPAPGGSAPPAPGRPPATPGGSASLAAAPFDPPAPGGRGVLLLPLLLLGLAAAWFLTRGPPPPTEVTWTVRGDALVVTFRGDPAGVRLEVEGREPAPVRDAGEGRARAVARGLPADREVRARLAWGGGETAWTPHRAGDLAVVGVPGLGPEAGLELEVVRACEAGWRGAAGPRRALAPGRHTLPVGENPRGPWTLVLAEEGLEFERTFRAEDVHPRAVAALRRALGAADVDDLARAMADAEDAAAAREPGPVAALGEALPWVPRLLAGVAPVAARRGLLRDVQGWQRIASLERARGLGSPDLLPPTGAAGSRRRPGTQAYAPVFEGEAVRSPKLTPDRGYGHNVFVDRYELASRYVGAIETFRNDAKATELAFPWPADAPRDQRVLALSVQIGGLMPNSMVRVTTREEGEGGFRVLYWHDAPAPVDNPKIHGWHHVLLPADLAPEGGTEMVLELVPFFRPESLRCDVYGVKVSWRRGPDQLEAEE